MSLTLISVFLVWLLAVSFITGALELFLCYVGDRFLIYADRVKQRTAHLRWFLYKLKKRCVEWRA